MKEKFLCYFPDKSVSLIFRIFLEMCKDSFVNLEDHLTEPNGVHLADVF